MGADLQGANGLRAQAGWNQTVGDWQRLLCWEPGGCFGAQLEDGSLAATVTTTSYGSAAWVGMMLVDQAMRRQGLGRAMLSYALEWLQPRVETVALDATPIGKTLYDQMDFVDVYTLQRHEAIAPEVATSEGVRRLLPEDLPGLRELDAAAFFGLDRLRVLSDLRSAHATGCWLSTSAEGYVLSRPGARAWYVGPLIAKRSDVAEMLLCAALSPLAGQTVLMDIPDGNPHMRVLAARYGFAPRRPFIRMHRGKPLPSTCIDWCYGIAGPELG